MRQSFGKKSYFSAAEQWWKMQDETSRNIVIAGISGLAVFFAGGIVLHAALTGLAINGFFWYGMWNPDMKEWMQTHGRKLDVLLTVGSILAALAVGPTVGMSMMFIAGFFSIIRRAICPPSDVTVNNNKVSHDDTVEGEFIPDEVTT